MSRYLASRWLIALVSMLLAGSLAQAQEQAHPRVAHLFSIITDYFDQSEGWPTYSPNEFGATVAIRGETAAVGMPRINEARGKVALYQRMSSGWQRTGTLVQSDAAPGQGFGASLTFRDNTIVVGGYYAAYVFKLVNGTWRQRQKLTIPATHTGLQFPASLVYQDNLVVAGATSTDGATSAVYLFQLTSAGKLVQRTRLLSPNGPSSTWLANDRFGDSVAMSNTHLLIGAPGAEAAYLYERAGSGWRRVQKLTADDPRSGAFGESVAINNGVIVIGAPYSDFEGGWGSDQTIGAAYLFTRTAGAYQQQQKLTPSTVPDEYSGWNFFGYDIAMSGDRIAIASYDYDSGGTNPRGAVYSYRLRSGGARQTGFARDFIAAASIALANNWLVVGSPDEYETLGWESFGEAAIFDINRFQ